MAKVKKEYHYPQTYFLEPEALMHFGIKARTYKRWIDSGIQIPGRYKVKGTNYYVIDPYPFHLWLIETKLETATKHNKFHNRKPKNSLKGGNKSREDVPGVADKNFHAEVKAPGSTNSKGLTI